MSIVDFLQLSLIMDLMRELDYEPRVDVFRECSPEQYEALSEQDYDTSTRWFVMSRGADAASEPRTEVRLVSEPERDLIVGAALGIQDETDASGETFSSFRERVEHVSNKMPELVCVQGGPRPRPRVAVTVPGPT
jgi:hypothetical protein